MENFRIDTGILLSNVINEFNLIYLSSSRNCYGNNQVAHVQVKRETEKCFLLTKFTLNHRIKTSYLIKVMINEKNIVFDLAKCSGCGAVVGECNHSVFFLMITSKERRTFLN